MAVKLTRKEKIALQKQAGGVSPKQKERTEKSRHSLKRMLGLLLAIAGFLFYSNTLSHDYVLDDFGLIKDNSQTKKGISAVPDIFKSSYRYGMNFSDYQLYRPLTKAMFAVEWDIAPNTPSLSHWINVLFFALLCYVLFIVLSRYMNDNLFIPFITVLLFAVHPIHTEVVANIKGRDEIVCFLLCFTAIGALHSYVTKNSTLAFITGIACYFIALFAKESAITFLAVIPLFFYFFTNAGKEKYVRTLTAMVVCTIIFLLIRHSVLGNVKTLIPVEDNSIAGIDGFFGQRATAISIMGVYLKLMVFPSPLIADGSYNHFPEIALTSWKFFVPFIIFLASGIYAFVMFKKKDTVSFAIIYFFVTASIVSNVIMLIGTNYGERLMFMPSLGFCLIVAILISRLFKTGTEVKIFSGIQSFFKEYSKPLLAVFVIVILFAIQTHARNAEWESDFTLYSNDVKKVPDSAHMLFYYANHISADEYIAKIPDSASRDKTRNEAIEYLTRAVTIFPKYADGYQRRGYIYSQVKNMEQAEKDYREALKYNPTHPIVYNNYGTLCFNQNRYPEAMENFKQAIRYNPVYAHALNNLASVYGVFGMSESEMINRDPANKDQHTKLARENFETAISFFLRSIDADPDFSEPYRLLAVTYRNIGDPAMADKYDRLFNKVNSKVNVKN